MKTTRSNFLSRATIVAGILFCAASVLAQLPPGFKGGPTNAPLDSWSFGDNVNWTSDNGYAPVSFTNLGFSYLGDGASLVVNSNVPGWLQYNVVETNGATNLTVDVGSVTFWFGPGWSSANDTNGGVGPQEWGRLFETGEYTTNSSYGWWSIYVDDVGENIYFSSQTNDGLGDTYTISAPIDWTTNNFHFVALTYSGTNVSIYLDGQLATNDPGGLSIWPGADVLSNGFYIGSDSTGVWQAEGMFDSVYTYNYPLDTNDVERIYNWEHMAFEINPFNIPYMDALSPAPSNPSSSPTYYEAITGVGNLQLVSSATNGYNGTNAYNVWITNVTASAANNGTITFTIEGGSNGVPFDVFANSVLSFGTNGIPWVWEGQGYQWNTYTITNIGSSICFVILGTPQDSDGDGLTDAYKLLVSKTSLTNPDVNGDGLGDAWDILLGLSPFVNQNAQPGTRSNYSYTSADWLNGISGVRTGSVTLDNEGNVLSVSQ